MADNSKPGRAEKKRETWEEREARKLRRNVYDHLAYYIQIQLPEEKFDGQTGTRSSNRRIASANPSKTRVVSSTKSYAKSRRQKSLNEQPPKKAQEDQVRTSEKYKQEALLGKDDVKKPQNDKRQGSRSSGNGPSYSSSRTRRPNSRRKHGYHETLRSSPFAADPLAKNIGKSKSAENMRKEAERVAATATKLLGDLRLHEVVAVQRFQSSSKSLLRCSSSLSQHPNGMLTSNKAIRYAAKNDDREAARRYKSIKKRAEREERMREKERERKKLTSSQSYQRKYQKPLSPLVSYLSESESSDSSDEEVMSSSTASMSSRSSLSTVRKATSPRYRTSSSSSSDMQSDTSTQNFIRNAKDSRETSSNNIQTTDDHGGREFDNTRTEDGSVSPSLIGSSSATSSVVLSSASENLQNGDYKESTSSGERSSAELITNKSRNHSAISSDSDESENENFDVAKDLKIHESKSEKLVANSHDATPVHNNIESSSSSDSDLSDTVCLPSISADTDSQNNGYCEPDVIPTSPHNVDNGQSSPVIAIRRAISLSVSNTSDTTDLEGNQTNVAPVQRKTSQPLSESDLNDTSSMTSSLRKIIEDAQMSFSSSSSSSSRSSLSSDSFSGETKEESIFGSNLPDKKLDQHSRNGGEHYLESGGEVLTSVASELM